MIDWPKLIRALAGQPEPSDCPVFLVAGEISGSGVYSILKDKFPNASIYISDLTFQTCSKEEVQKIIDWSKVQQRKYVVEAFDCDDFSYALQGAVSIYPWSTIPFGIIWTNKHALNFFVSSDRKVWFVEPQKGQIQETLEAWQGDEIQLLVV
jgi:hypothetical protein